MKKAIPALVLAAGVAAAVSTAAWAADPKARPAVARTLFRRHTLAEGTGFDKHDLVLRRGGKVLGRTKTIAAGKSGSFTVTLEKGSYTYECDRDGHAAKGMKGTLKVG